MIENKSLTTSILEHLRGEIITSQLKGGQKLNENHISSELKVSRPPLREAFQILEQEHLLVSVPRKGRFVVEISEQNYQKIYEARKMIECYVIDLLEANNIRTLPQVELAMKKVLEKSMPSDDPYEKLHYIEAIDDFHINLVNSVKNEFLSHFYGTLQFNIYRYHYWLRVLCSPLALLPQAAQSLIQEHRRVLDFIQMGKYEKAKDCLQSHMDKAFRLMKENFSKTRRPEM
jgi:DNA-binding GntR family transcriptional regulator